MRKSLLIVPLIIGLLSLFVMPSVSAAKCGGVTTAILECNETAENSIFNLLNTAIDIMSVAVGILGIIGITVFGVQYLTAGGNEQKVTKAKRRLFEVIIGLIVYAVLFSALRWLDVLPKEDHQSTKEEASLQEHRENMSESDYTIPTNNTQSNSNKNKNKNQEESSNEKTYMGVTLKNYSSIKSITADMIVKRAKTIINYAQKNGWSYGDSHGVPPGSDKYISCDRLASITLYTLGFTKQPKGGFALNNGFLGWLKNDLGFKESNSTSDIKRGSIVWLRYDANEKVPSGAIGGHVFIVSSWNKKTKNFVRYDAGKEWNKSQPRITSKFPYKVLNNDYKKYFKVFNLP